MNRRIIIASGIASAVLLILVLAIWGVKRMRGGKAGAASLYNTAYSLQSKGELDEAVKRYRELIDKFAQDEKAAQAWYQLGEIYEKENFLLKARDAYARLIADFPNFSAISQAERKLWDLNIRILFSPLIDEDAIIYKVEAGDTLGKIAAKHNTTVDLIMRSNNLKSSLIRPGNRLKISTAKYSIIVDKSQNLLTLKSNEQVFKVYPVATGKYDSTPVGTFQIVVRLEHPDWYKNGVGIIPADSPKNVLGTRWLGLSEPKYGIHGGASAADLNNQVTDGCVRMTDSDVEELFTILPRGVQVTIVE